MSRERVQGAAHRYGAVHISSSSVHAASRMSAATSSAHEWPFAPPFEPFSSPSPHAQDQCIHHFTWPPYFHPELVAVGRQLGGCLCRCSSILLSVSVRSPFRAHHSPIRFCTRFAQSGLFPTEMKQRVIMLSSCCLGNGHSLAGSLACPSKCSREVGFLLHPYP